MTVHLSGTSPPVGSLLPRAAAPGCSSILLTPLFRLTSLRHVPVLLSLPAWDAAAYTALLAEDQSPVSGRLGGWHRGVLPLTITPRQPQEVTATPPTASCQSFSLPSGHLWGQLEGRPAPAGLSREPKETKKDRQWQRGSRGL